jgi:hypothetical protein
MASRAHQFIADMVSRKMYQEGYEVVAFEGENSMEMVKLHIPPRILRHRPDLIGVKDQSIAIGEAKTADDFSSRTREQLLDFTFKEDSQNDVNKEVYFGIPMSIEEKFRDLMGELGISNGDITILAIPDRLLPQDNEENNLPA